MNRKKKWCTRNILSIRFPFYQRKRFKSKQQNQVNSDKRYHNMGWFGKHPRIYEIGSKLLAKIRRRAVQALSSDKQMNILDIACGTGALTFDLAKFGHNVIGLDLDRNMLTYAKQKLQKYRVVRLVQGDASQLLFEDSVFDAVTICFAMHDVPFEIGIKILKECKRVIKQNGKIIIIDYNEPKKHIVAGIVNQFVRIFESPNYGNFVRIGLKKYLENAQLILSKRFTILGAFQIILCH